MKRIVDNTIHSSFRKKRNLVGPQSGLTHIRLILPANPTQCVHAGDGLQPYFVVWPAPGLDQIGCDAAQTVAGTLRFAAILIEDSDAKKIAVRTPENQAIAADCKVTVADPSSEICVLARNLRRFFDKDEIVSEGMAFDKRNHPK